MTRIAKLLILALITFIVGAIVFVVGFFIAGGKIDNLRHIEARYFQYLETENSKLHTVSISYEIADIEVVLSDEADTISVTYPSLFNKKGKEGSKITISDDNGHLIIREKTNWLYTSFTVFGNPEAKLTLVIPAEKGYALSLKTDNGDVSFQGEIGRFKSVAIETDNGDINMKNTAIFCQENVNFETDNGSVSLGRVTANKIQGETDNGHIKVYGNIVGKQVTFSSDNGAIKTFDNYYIDSEKVTFETDNGDIKTLLLGEKNLYNVAVRQDNGSSNITAQTGGSRTLNIETDNGDIRIYFTH